ncbi:formylglycine-generating enzyme family protein [Mangrovimonas aestuarii]|uniref:formylglycine-generating enzyme family protein n=1 Tax=Mangrovimonas aestuarii TaxID=3018443 RepID=UPI002379EAB0|nr:formylglycine-generating enzyme family protein [Mangrovimonas aestuarii]
MRKTASIFSLSSVVLLVFLVLSCNQLNEKESANQLDQSMAEDRKDSLITAKGACGSGLSKRSMILNASNKNEPKGMVFIPEGEFMMGGEPDKLALDREFPKHPVQVSAFYMDTHEVTNAQFAEFVKETGYITSAERDVDWEELKKQLPPNTPKPADSSLKAGSLVFTPTSGPVPLNDFSQWWRWVTGANWKHPFGPDSSIEGMDNHPVVQVSIEDAKAYATWAGKRLPTEAEWEWASRGGLEHSKYPWGDEHVEVGDPKCNYWTGKFPYDNTEADGFRYTAPVESYEPNGYGLYDMAGNVWEICTDWFDVEYYKRINASETLMNPIGPTRSYNPPNQYEQFKTLRGGSFLCNDSYCASYRVSARMPLEVTSSLNHVGFRCVKDVK